MIASIDLTAVSRAGLSSGRPWPARMESIPGRTSLTVLTSAPLRFGSEAGPSPSVPRRIQQDDEAGFEVAAHLHRCCWDKADREVGGGEVDGPLQATKVFG